MKKISFYQILIMTIALATYDATAALPEGNIPQDVAAATTGATLMTEATPEIVPKGFRFDGNTVISTEDLTALGAQWIGKPIGFKGLSAVTEAVRALYHGRGYLLAVAYLPPQQIEDGVIRIGIMEGKIGKVSVNTSSQGPRPRIGEDQVRNIIAAHVPSDAAVTDAMLERPLLLVEDLIGNGVKSSLVAGAERGSADLDVELRGDPRKGLITGSVELDNFGNDVTGEERLHLKLDVNGLASFGDQLSLNGFVTRSNLSTFGTISYLAPLGSTGLRAGFGYGRLSYVLGQEFAVLEAEGEVRLLEAYLTYPLLRSRNANLHGRVGLFRKEIESQSAFFANEDIRDQGLLFQLNGDRRASNYAQAFAVSWTAAEASFTDEAQRLQDAGANGFKTQGWFHKLSFDAQHLQQIRPNLSWSVRGAGQYSSQNLIGAEKFSLGGPDRVRAYPTGEASGDVGWLASTEVRWTFPEIQALNYGLSVSGFYDYGKVYRNRHSSDAPAIDRIVPNKRSLDAYGFGLRFGREDRFVIRTDLAWPGSKTAGYDSDHPRVWLQSILWF